jgi:DNA replication protein DnaC
MEAVKLSEIVSPPDSLSANRCESCGYGYKHKDQTGLRKWCKRCIDVFFRRETLTDEFAECRILKLVGSLYTDAKLDDLDQDVREKLLGLAYGQDVFVYGPVGTGKTYSMAALLRYYVYEGFECWRINFDDFCVQVRSTMGPASKQTEYELIEPLKEIDKLFIDDIGLRSKQETDFAYVTLYSILNKRQERSLPTFVSTNKSIEQLGQSFDSRIASRLQTALIIEMTGADRRRLRQF